MGFESPAQIFQKRAESLWFGVVVLYLALLGGLMYWFAAHAAGSVTVCASGCDYTTIAAAEADPSLSTGGVIHVQATYDPSAEQGTTITASQADVTIDCESSGAYLGTLAATTTIYLDTTGAGGIQNCNARRLEISRNLAAGTNNGFTVSGMTFDPASISSINLNSFVSSTVQNSSGYFQVLTSSSTDPVISGNSFTASAGVVQSFIKTGDAGPIGMFTINNNTFTFTDYDPSDISTNPLSGFMTQYVFTNNRVIYSGSVLNQTQIMTFDRSAVTFTGNVFQTPFTLDGVVRFKSETGNAVTIQNNTFMTSTTAASTLVRIDTADGPGAPAGNFTIAKNLFYNLSASKGNPLIPTASMASSTLSGTSAVKFVLNQTQTLNITENYNGFYGFAVPYRDLVGGFTANSNDKTTNPFMRLDNVSTSDDWEPAPWSSYLDVGGTSADIGAYSASRRNSIHIIWSGTPVDYSTNDATDILYVVTSTAGLRNGDSIDMTSGIYTFTGLTSSTELTSGLTITGPGGTTAAMSEITATSADVGRMRFDGIDNLSLINLYFSLAGGTNALYVGHSSGLTLSHVTAHLNTNDTMYTHNALVLDTVTNGTISDVITDFDTITPTASSTSVYTINKTAFSKSGIDYVDSAGVGSPANEPFYFNGSGCSIRDIPTSSTDITSTIGGATNNWNLALLTVSGVSHITAWVQNNFHSSASTINADCSGFGVVVDAFVTNAFTVSGGTYSYHSDTVSAAGITPVAGYDSSPAITHTTGLVLNGGGIMLLNSSNNSISNSTSTNAGCGVSLDGTSTGNTFTAVSATATSTGSDLCSNATGSNIFIRSTVAATSTAFGPDAGVVSSTARVRVFTGERVGGAAIANVPVTISTVSSSTIVTSGVDGFTPYTGYFEFDLVSPPTFTISAAATGDFLASSTAVTGLTNNQLISLGMSTDTPGGGTNDVGTGGYRGPDANIPHIDSFAINDGALITTSTQVTLTLVATNARSMGFSLTSDFVNAAVSLYQKVSTFVLDGLLGKKRIYAVVDSNTNSFSNIVYQDITLVASTTLAGPVDTPTISAPTNTATTTINLAITYGANAVQMMLANTPDFSGAEWQAVATSTLWHVTQGDGSKTIYLKVRSGFATESAAASAITHLSTQPVGAPTFTSPTNNARVTGGVVTFTGTADARHKLELVVSTNKAEVLRATPSVASDGTWSYVVPRPLPVGVYHAAAIASDLLGHTAQDVTVFSILDAPPSIPLVVMTPTDGAHVTTASLAAAGTGTVGAKIVIVRDGLATYTGTVSSDGTWRVPFMLPARNGVYSLEYQMVDGANTVIDSLQRSITLTLPPIIPPPPPDTGKIPTKKSETGGSTSETKASVTSTESIATSTLEIVTTTESVVPTSTIENTVDTFTPTLTQITTAPRTASTKIVKAAVTTAGIIRDITQTPEVQVANQAVVVPIAAVATAATASAAVNGMQLALYARFLFTQPLFLLNRRKRKGWGMAYNAISKMPADLALIRVVDEKTGRVISSHVTDRDGRYQFFVKPGTYKIEATKPGLSFPPVYMQGKTEDGALSDLYTGGAIPLSAASHISYNLPLDPGGDMRAPKEILRAETKKRVAAGFGAAGLVLTALAFAVSPTWYVGAFLLAHVVSFVIFRRLAIGRKPKSWGVVRDANNQPIGRAIVRVFDTEYNKLLETQVTDDDGRYSFLVGSNNYYVMVEKQGFVTQTTVPIAIVAPEGGAVLGPDVTLQHAMPVGGGIPIQS